MGKRTSRIVPVMLALVLVAACGGNSSTPTQPSTPTTPARTTFTLTGGVVDSKVASNKVQNATLTINDGANSGRSTTADGAGNYRFDNLTPGTFSMTGTGGGYLTATHSVTLGSADASFNFLMDPPIFVKTGTGVNVFDMPTYITRVRIQGSYGGFCENFIVRIAGRGAVNEILGTCSVASGRTFDGTIVTTGGTTEIVQGPGVGWSFTEVR